MNCYDCIHFGTLEEENCLYCAIKGKLGKVRENCNDLRQSEASKIYHEFEIEVKKPKIKSLLRY